MTETAAGFVLALLLSTLYGAGFHLVMGGPARRIPIFVVASWLGFASGHFLGEFLQITWLKLGAINLLTASVGAWVLLFLSLWLTKEQARS